MEIGRVEDQKKLLEVFVSSQYQVISCWEGEPVHNVFGFTCRKSVNPQDCLSRVVRPVP